MSIDSRREWLFFDQTKDGASSGGVCVIQSFWPASEQGTPFFLIRKLRTLYGSILDSAGGNPLIWRAAKLQVY